MKLGLQAEKRYWHDILKRVVAVIKFLSERGLPFRGDNEIINSPHNGISVLELISIGFITEFRSMGADEIEKAAQNLQQCYPNDLELSFP